MMNKFFKTLILIATVCAISCSKSDIETENETVTPNDESTELTDPGSGTEEDPYIISTAEQLRELSTNVNSGISYEGEYFLMTNDIDLGGINESGEGIAENEFTAIGYYTSHSENPEDSEYSYFRGTFNGGGYEVSGLYINQPDTYHQGLFGIIYGATIKNLGVSGSVLGSSYVGGVVGLASFYSTVTECYNTSKVIGNSSYVGGVAGSSFSTMTECYNSGEVSGTSLVGGVAGSAYTITACYNTSEVIGTDNYVGGVAGLAYDYSTVTMCHNSGEVSGSGYYIGGVVGLAYTSSTVTECYNTSKVSGEGSNVGGVVGYAYSIVTACYNAGEVSGGGNSVGGVVGNTESTTAVTACYNTGDISGNGGYIGGVVGWAYSYSTTTACYNTGEVSGSERVGSVVGYAYSSIITACYYDSTAYSDNVAIGYNNGSTVTDVEGKTTSEMTANNFVELLNSATDKDYWIADSYSINNGYPILIWQ